MTETPPLDAHERAIDLLRRRITRAAAGHEVRAALVAWGLGFGTLLLAVRALGLMRPLAWWIGRPSMASLAGHAATFGFGTESVLPEADFHPSDQAPSWAHPEGASRPSGGAFRTRAGVRAGTLQRVRNDGGGAWSGRSARVPERDVIGPVFSIGPTAGALRGYGCAV